MPKGNPGKYSKKQTGNSFVLPMIAAGDLPPRITVVMETPIEGVAGNSAFYHHRPNRSKSAVGAHRAVYFIDGIEAYVFNIALDIEEHAAKAKLSQEFAAIVPYAFAAVKIQITVPPLYSSTPFGGRSGEETSQRQEVYGLIAERILSDLSWNNWGERIVARSRTGAPQGLPRPVVLYPGNWIKSPKKHCLRSRSFPHHSAS